MIRVVGTGGTIVSLSDPDTGGVRPALSAAELVDSIAGLDAYDPIAVDEVDRVNGWNVTPATMLRLARRVAEVLEDDAVDGVVVTHGTDTLEETAFLCDITVASPKPVAFAAAMRSGDEVAADGPRNLLHAARVASDPAAGDMGTVVVLGDEVHAARWVRKQDSHRTSAFSSPGRGAIGVVRAGSPVMVMRPPERVTVPLPEAFVSPVPVLQTYTGMEEGLIASVLEVTRAGGLVLEGTGLGNVPGTAEPGVRAALGAGLPVVVATRMPTGGTGAVYGGPGGGVTLRELGVLEAGELPAAKARLLLMTLLATTASPPAAERAFAATVARLARW